jgi:DNA-binding IclR family transcriptional regulator
MSRLQEQTGLLIFLSIWGNRGPVIVSKVDATVELLLSVRVGFVLPLYRAATGRVFLAFMPRSVVKPVLDREAEADAALKRRAEASLPDIRRERLAMSDSQLNVGFASMSAPIFDYAGNLSASVTALGMRNEFNLDLHGPVAGLVRSTAAEISRALGHVPTEEEREPAPRAMPAPSLVARTRRARAS